MILTTPSFHSVYPGACCGFLAVSGAANPPAHPGLEETKQALQEDLRSLYSTEAALREDPVLAAYAAYYRRFKKTYHVALQLESVAQRGKPIPSVAGLVECMFMAELHDRLLTAGHDFDMLQLPVTVSVAQGSETYTLLRGTEQVLKAGDLYMADGQGVISSIIYGPDQRTQITSRTSRALFAVYAPPGIGPERVQAHMESILGYIRMIAPQVRVELSEVVSAQA